MRLLLDQRVDRAVIAADCVEAGAMSGERLQAGQPTHARRLTDGFGGRGHWRAGERLLQFIRHKATAGARE